MTVDYGRWVSRTWDIFSRYRVLWVLGLVAALISGGTGAFQTVIQRIQPAVDINGQLDPGYVNFLVGAGCLGLLVNFLLSFIGAAAQAALIRTTDHIAQTGEEPRFATAWGLGWPKMLAVWLFNFVLGLAGAIIALILLLPAIIIGGGAFITLIQQSLTLSSNSDALNAAGGALVFACLCFCGALLLLIPLAIAFYLTSEFGVRALVLEDQGVFQAIGTGWQMVRANLGKSLIGLLIIVVIAIFVAVVTGAILAPLGAVLGLSAVNFGATNGGINREVATGPLVALGLVSWLVGAAVGTFTTAFTSVFWTTLYRSLRGMPNSDLAPVGLAPAPGGPAYGSPYGAPPPYTPPGGAPSPYPSGGGTPTQAMPPYPPPAGAPPPYPPPYTPPAGSPPPYTPPTGSPPPYPPPAGSPPPYTPPAGGPPPYTPPTGGPPAYTPPAGGVQYGSPPSPPPIVPEEPPASAPNMPDDRARGPEGESGTTS